MGLLIINPGHSATIQDRGRAGHREWGVPVGGAFDRDSLDIANGLLGNAPDSAAIELTLFGGVYEAQTPLAIALAGAPMDARLIAADGTEHSLAIPLCCSLKSGERLRLGGTAVGVRTYLAVRGGWQTAQVLGSRSESARLNAGVVLPAEDSSSPTRHLRLPPWPDLATEPIRVLAGPDASRVADLDAWLESRFEVTRQYDRMGLRMAGRSPQVRDVTTEPLSTPVTPGTIQLAGGQILILGVDCGTMGGYPQVAQIISADMARIAQLREGQEISFRRVSLAEARSLDHQKRQAMHELIQRLTVLALAHDSSLS